MSEGWTIAILLWLNVNVLFLYWRHCRAVQKGDWHG